MLKQGLRRDVNANFIIAHAGNYDLAHSGQGFQIIADRTDGALERLFLCVTEERDHNGRHLGFELGNVNFFSFLGQIAQVLDRPLDLIDCFGKVADL